MKRKPATACAADATQPADPTTDPALAATCETHATRELPVADPLPELSPRAARLLEAAKVILARDGFERLTFEAIAAESGENGSLIRYHFGGKAGLVDALVDSIIYQGSAELLAALRAAPPGEERRAVLLETHRRWVEDRDEYRTFYALLSHALFDDALRGKYASLFEWYVNLEAAPPPPLLVAVTDGLALQGQSRAAIDAPPIFDILGEMLSLYRVKHEGVAP